MSKTAIIIVGIVAIVFIFSFFQWLRERNHKGVTPVFPGYPIPTQGSAPEVEPIDLTGVEVNPDAPEIYNLLILDGSGSMLQLRKAARIGYNQTLNAIREAQKAYASEQQHFASFVVFNNDVTKVFENESIVKVKNLNMSQYIPDGCTAMFDAIGMSLSELKKHLNAKQTTVAVVTIISDGMENASKEYDLEKVVSLIEEFKDMGCTINFMGPSYKILDRLTYAEHMSKELHIDNYLAFEYTDEGFRDAWDRQSNAFRDYYGRIRDYEYEVRNMSEKERREYYRRKSQEDKFYGL
jgi:hypothetical protein